MTAADELAAAARTLRDRHADLDHPEPWRSMPVTLTGRRRRVTTGHGNGMREVTPDMPAATADFIATMQPAIAAALADWLDAEADRLTATAHPAWHDTIASPHALTIARHINQEPR